ncbi:hypothetical protein C7M84_009101 [Penaeus vannamei]|uniref:Uncharacterized protein n=1 Tax=Penaeus vannamei TaxID=6689 RepID=A0A3R7M5G2_PENVA|nr:hypothetical protein C7M84_009101 [Penaeus vannamei]
MPLSLVCVRSFSLSLLRLFFVVFSLSLSLSLSLSHLLLSHPALSVSSLIASLLSFASPPLPCPPSSLSVMLLLSRLSLSLCSSLLSLSLFVSRLLLSLSTLLSLSLNLSLSPSSSLTLMVCSVAACTCYFSPLDGGLSLVPLCCRLLVDPPPRFLRLASASSSFLSLSSLSSHLLSSRSLFLSGSLLSSSLSSLRLLSLSLSLVSSHLSLFSPSLFALSLSLHPSSSSYPDPYLVVLIFFPLGACMSNSSPLFSLLSPSPHPSSFLLLLPSLNCSPSLSLSLYRRISSRLILCSLSLISARLSSLSFRSSLALSHFLFRACSRSASLSSLPPTSRPSLLSLLLPLIVDPHRLISIYNWSVSSCFVLSPSLSFSLSFRACLPPPIASLNTS